MRLPPADPAERARGALGRGRGRGVYPRAAGEVPGRSRRAASSGIRCGSRGRRQPMGVSRLTAVAERANDTGVRCTLRRFRSAHPGRRVSGAEATSCARAACSADAARAAQAVTLAYPQSLREGCRAPLRGDGGPVGPPAGRRAVRHRRARPGRWGCPSPSSRCRSRHAENRLRILAFRLKVGKLRDVGRTHRRRDDSRQDPTAPSHIWRTMLLSAKFPLRRSCSPSSEESNDGTHETKSALLRRR